MNYIYCNGKIFLKDEANIVFDTDGVLFGWGMFETMRIYQGNIFLLQEHLTRLVKSCSLFDIPFTLSNEKIVEELRRYIQEVKIQNSVLRITVIKKDNMLSTLFFSIRPILYVKQDYLRGFSALVMEQKRNRSSLLTYHKTTSYLENKYSHDIARKKGYQECLFLNDQNEITEGSMSNVFFIKNKVLYTPSVSCGLLPGITRNYICNTIASSLHIPVREGHFMLNDIFEAQECFLTNSVMQIMPLIRIDKRKIGLGRPGNITKMFIHKYQDKITDLIKMNEFSRY